MTAWVIKSIRIFKSYEFNWLKIIDVAQGLQFRPLFFLRVDLVQIIQGSKILLGQIGPTGPDITSFASRFYFSRAYQTNHITRISASLFSFVLVESILVRPRNLLHKYIFHVDAPLSLHESIVVKSRDSLCHAEHAYMHVFTHRWIHGVKS